MLNIRKSRYAIKNAIKILIHYIKLENLSIHPNLKRLKSPIQAFFGWRAVTFPTERIQSLTSAYMGEQWRLLVLHDVDHQLHAKSESGDEHIPF